MLKIGIDLDGVVFDSEQTFRTYEEIFDIERNQNKLINREEPKFQQRYSWSIKYYLEISQTSPIMSGFKKVYELLKDKDIEFIAITARGLTPTGETIEEMIIDAKKKLEENHIKFDKYYFKNEDKVDICLKENIDFMIDDDYRIIQRLAANNIKSIYFRDVGLKQLEENEYIKEVNNWGDIYRFIIERCD